jgi:hypothetical protein
MVLTFPLAERQRWQLYSKFQDAHLLLLIMFLAVSIYQHSPLAYLLFMAHTGVWVLGVAAPGEGMKRFFGLSTLLLIVSLRLGYALV